MITEELKALVKDEAEKLKIHATPEELEKLDSSELDPEHTELCIYGQMTGDCFSERAGELIIKCAQPYSTGLHNYHPAEATLFGAFYSRDYYSPIEFYVSQDGAKPKSLINFLQSRSETINL